MPGPVTILIVEDEALVLEIAVLEFEDAGFTVLPATDGEAALEILASAAQIDVLFTDISLRNSIDGWALAAQARALRPELGVVYATGYAPDAPQLVEGSLFFKKPYLPTTIIAAVRELTKR